MHVLWLIHFHCFSHHANPLLLVTYAKVAAISGAGQQHAMVLFSSQAAKLLASLDPAQSLASQLAPAFASPTVTNWQDSSVSVLFRSG